MFKSIMAFLLMVFLIVIFILWVAAITESDGHCHYDDCDNCMYRGDCPEEHK